MKFLGYITESSTDIETLQRECSQYLKLKVELFRGVADNTINVRRITPRIDREPRDTNKFTHNYINDLFQKKFGWGVRSEGVFVSSNWHTAHSYVRDNNGMVYRFFPVNGYKYVWSPKVDDFFLVVRRLFPVYDISKPLPEVAWGNFKLDMGAVLDILGQSDKIPEIYQFKNPGEISKFVSELIVGAYKNTGLKEAVESEHEIAFKCKAYYLQDITRKDAWNYI